MIKIDSQEAMLLCFPVIAELRLHITKNSFIEKIERQVKEGYQLWGLSIGNEIVSIIGFRIQNFLAWGKTFYIDDFATHSNYRGNGYASYLMKWAIQQAKDIYNCDEIHLDTGYTRHNAHKLYLKHGFELKSHHLCLDIRKG